MTTNRHCFYLSNDLQACARRVLLWKKRIMARVMSIMIQLIAYRNENEHAVFSTVSMLNDAYGNVDLTDYFLAGMYNTKRWRKAKRTCLTDQGKNSGYDCLRGDDYQC